MSRFSETQPLPPQEATAILMALIHSVGGTVDVSHSRGHFCAVGRLAGHTFIVGHDGVNNIRNRHKVLVLLADAMATAIDTECENTV
jgi:hypothetical protein